MLPTYGKYKSPHLIRRITISHFIRQHQTRTETHRLRDTRI